jgi:hypothetical protein
MLQPRMLQQRPKAPEMPNQMGGSNGYKSTAGVCGNGPAWVRFYYRGEASLGLKARQN